MKDGPRVACKASREYLAAPEYTYGDSMQNKRSCLFLIVSSSAIVILGACHHQRGAKEGDGDREHDEHSEEGTSPELGSGMSTHFAVRSIARARCDREERCSNIGPDKSYESVGACETKIRGDWADDLNKYECPKGVVQTELDQCLADIRAEDCNSPFDTLARVAECTSNQICDE